MSISEARAKLASRQRGLLQALNGNASEVTSFDEKQIAAVSAALLQKRMRGVAKAWPALAAALGERFGQLFAEYARSASYPAHGAHLADGCRFAATLARCGKLPSAGWLAVLRFELRYKEIGDKWVPRRLPVLRLALLRRPFACALALRLPWLGEHCFFFGGKNGKVKTG